MELGKNSARIVDYGITKTKLGSAQVFVKLLVAGVHDTTWYGVPFKKDGEVNEFMMTQLAYCGFDLSRQTIEDLAAGMESGILITDEDIDVYVRNETNGSGDLVPRVNTLGSVGPIRVDEQDLKVLISQEQSDKLKASASKFKARKKSAKKDNPSDDVPF